MMNFYKSITLAMSLVAAATSLNVAQAQTTSEQWLQPFDARYVVTRGGSEYGEANRTLKQESDNQYSMRMVTDISWLFLSDKRTLFSQFSLAPETEADGAATLRAHQFKYERKGTGSDKSFAADFDNEAEQVLAPDSGAPLAVEWTSGLIDEATALVQLQLDLAAFDAQRNRRGADTDANSGETVQWRYQVIDEKGQRDELVFKLVPAPGHEDTQNYRHVLDLPYGKVEVLAVQRVRENSTRKTDYWFAPELGYNLVRMKQSKDGDETATLELSSFQYQ